MSLRDDIKVILDHLAPRGWQVLLAEVTSGQLNIAVPLAQLEAELTKPLGGIQRDRHGFQEFTTGGKRAIEPGEPGRSLLYHALASADVRPLRHGRPSDDPDDYPTLADLDTLENYIYSLKKRQLSEFTQPVIAVFAYQYRPMALSTHRQHADLAFSRTGVARVGTEPAQYDPVRRAFDPHPAGARGFRVLPSRYAVFLAEARMPGPGDAVLRPVPEVDAGLMFYFPVHKLFVGTECLLDDNGQPLHLRTLDFHAYHINEKLRRLHTSSPDNPDAVPPLPIFDLHQPPFVRDSRNTTDLVTLQRTGASVLVVSVPKPLACTATQTVGGAEQVARFKVPGRVNDGHNRFWTSLQLTFAPNSGRAAPEYANIRQRVSHPSDPHALEDINLLPTEAQFQQALDQGGYEAAHFIDQTCDGALLAKVQGLGLETVSAFSLVTAVDFFPEVEQVEIQEWIERRFSVPLGLDRPPQHFAQGGPKPLSDGRFTRTQAATQRTRRIPNATLPSPDAAAPAGARAFSTRDQTATAEVGRAPSGMAFAPLHEWAQGTSWLPEAASDVFAPGWDVSEHRNHGAGHSYVSYGLGSPFPEDAKLCAALNSFWPAVAPDASRTYGLRHTGLPLSDSELGYHANHPRVLAGEVAASRGWDGDFGPFLVRANGMLWGDCSDPNRADLTRQAFDGHMGFSGLDRVTTAELIRRMEEMRFCLGLLLPTASDPVLASNFWLVTFEPVPSWTTWSSAVLPRANAQLTGPGYIFVYAAAETTGQPFGSPPLRRRHRVSQRIEWQLSATRGFRRNDQQAFTQVR